MLQRGVKRLARGALARGPLYAWARARALGSGALTVLMYHTLGGDDEPFDAWTVVRRSNFERQMAWLRRHYTIVPLAEALGPPVLLGLPPAVITFDDGERGLHEHLLPIVERLALPVTVYVATGQIQMARPYWFDRAMNAMQVAQPTTLRIEGLPAVSLGSARGEDGWQPIAAVLEALKRLTPDARERATAVLEATLSVAPHRRINGLGPLSLAQLQALASSRWVTIGAHTHCHSLLDQLPLQAAVQTIEHSRKLLREWTGQPINHFAYPNGNHTAELAAAVERLGFHSAMATGKGLWRNGQGHFNIQRVPVGRWDDMDKFRLDLLGGAAAPWRVRGDVPISAPLA